jgi:hypothetical protein
MAGPTAFDRKVYAALDKPEFLPDEFKTWLPRYLRYLSQLQITKQQIPGITGENWHNVGAAGEVAFVSPWRNYGGGGTAYGNVRFYKDYLGIVHLEGVTETTGTPTGPTIFTLPAGYRPGETLIFTQRATTVVGQPVDTARIDIAGTGDVQVLNPDNSKFTSGSGLSLANIHFRAA